MSNIPVTTPRHSSARPAPLDSAFRPSAPLQGWSCPGISAGQPMAQRRTPAEREPAVLAAREQHRRGQDWLGPEVGLAPRTVARVLRRHRVPYLRECDPMTGEVIRSSKATAVRYEKDRPGELVHMDVKKIGRIPDGGGWRAHGRSMGRSAARRRTRVGYDYVHSLVDDHSRLAYSEVLPDEKGATCAGFLTRAAAHFAAAGIAHLEAVMTDNHYSTGLGHCGGRPRTSRPPGVLRAARRRIARGRPRRGRGARVPTGRERRPT